MFSTNQYFSNYSACLEIKSRNFLFLAAQNHNCQMSVPEKDRPLLEELVNDNKFDAPYNRYACTGRFLTMHKRRRKKLTTRSLLQDSAILDDVLHGQVQCILQQVGNWRFNAFTLETVTGGKTGLGSLSLDYIDL